MKNKNRRTSYTVHTCWSPLTTELVTSTEYMAVIKSHHSPPPPPPPPFLLPTLYMRRGVRRVCGVDEADCARVSEAAVFAEEEREAVSLRIRPARLASSRLPGSLKLFDDRTGQHHRRWGGETGAGGGGVWKPVICIQLFLSSCPAPLLLLPLLYLFLYPSPLSIPLLPSLRSVSETPSSSLKKLCAAARRPGLQPGEPERVCRKWK